MENVKELKVFNFTKENTANVKLHLGQTYTVEHDQYNNEDVKSFDKVPEGFCWMITSANSPFPVRNGTWFKGFNAKTMIKWFEDQGYVLQSIVGKNGDILFYKQAIPEEKTDVQISWIEGGIYKLVKAGYKLAAVGLYKSIYSCGLITARDAVDEIVSRGDGECNEL